jgi:cyclic pyranopterin phosphate synthase
MGNFSHLSRTGEASMVDLGQKAATGRRATVRGEVRVSQECAQQLDAAAVQEVVRTARIAGIQAAKQTATLVPLCHPIALTAVDLAITFDRETRTFSVSATTGTEAPTGVEMEGLCAASVAGITIYDMVKAVDPAAVVGPFQLMEKHGGTAGSWVREKAAHDGRK